MRATLLSYLSAWKSKNGSAGVTAWYVVLAAFAASCLTMLLEPRTFLGQGFQAHPLWYLPAVCLALFNALLPAENALAPARTTYRWTPILLALVPVVPPTVQWGVVFVAASGALAWIRHPAAERISGLFNGTAALWALCVGAANAYAYVLARCDNFSPLGRLLATVSQLLGSHTHHIDGRVLVNHEGLAYPVLASPDKFAGELTLLFLLGVVFLSLLYRLSVKRLVLLVPIMIAYAAVRTTWLIDWNVVERASIPSWDEVPTIVSFVPLIAIAGVLLCGPIAGRAPAVHRARSNHAKWYGLAAAGSFCVLLGWFWVDPGQRKHGKVMIDERYSRWEWSENQFNTKLYGVKTVYSYDNMVDTLAHYYPVVRNFSSINDEVLRDVSVLILKTPTAAYPMQVRQAIWRFVDRGGGVWLIGDHTDIFGMDTYLNSVGSRYGLTFEFDAAIDPDTNRQLYRPAALSHPIVRNLPLFLWYTSDALRSPWLSNDVILSTRLLLDNPDYSQNTFFGNFKPDLDEPIGPVIQAAAITSGRGRIAAWSDSTIFSNFAIFMPGKMELALASVNWLNRQNNPIPFRLLLLVIGFSLFFLSLLRCDAGLLAPGLWCGVALAIPINGALYEYTYPEPKPSLPLARIAFYEPDVASHLPVSYPVDDPTPDHYLTAFMAAQRIGKQPFVADTLEKAMDAPIIVFVHTHFGISPDDMVKLRSWAENGGRLILLDGGMGDRRELEQLADITGLRLQPIRSRQIARPSTFLFVPGFPLRADGVQEGGQVFALRGPSGSELGTTFAEVGITGGQPLITAQETPNVLAATISVGKGTATVTTTRDLFSDASLGENAAIPDDRQLHLLQVLYALYK